MGAMRQKKPIVRNSRYSNCFVAMPSFKSGRVVAHGPKASAVRQQAVDKGYDTPVLLFIPPKGAVCLY